VAAAQFSAIKDHLRALRDSSVVNERSGKVLHEVVQEGSGRGHDVVVRAGAGKGVSRLVVTLR
jgi:hypothetical protein